MIKKTLPTSDRSVRILFPYKEYKKYSMPDYKILPKYSDVRHIIRTHILLYRSQ